jgi:uncharacterized membrane protein
MKSVEILEPRDSAIHQRMTATLRLLTVVAGMVILVGGILLLVRQGNAITSFHTFLGEPTSLRLVPQIVSGALQGHALAIVQFGILLLIATPVIRVLFVGIGYALEQDWLYVAVALIVLAVLGSSLIGHKL